MKILSSILYFATQLHCETIEIRKHMDNIKRKEEKLRLKSMALSIAAVSIARTVTLEKSEQVQANQRIDQALDQLTRRTHAINTDMTGSDSRQVAGKKKGLTPSNLNSATEDDSHRRS